MVDIMHLLPGETIRACVDDTENTIRENAKKLGFDPEIISTIVTASNSIVTSRTQPNLLKAIMLLLYLVSQNAEIVDDQPYKKKRRAFISDTAQEIHSFSVGVRIGTAIRKAGNDLSDGSGPAGESIGKGRRKRPHSRRGHWHHYWIGPKDSEEIGEDGLPLRRVILKWLPRCT